MAGLRGIGFLKKLLVPKIDNWAPSSSNKSPKGSYQINFKALRADVSSAAVGLIASKKFDSSIYSSFEKACEEFGVQGSVFDPDKSSFFEEIAESRCDFFISRPNHRTSKDRNCFFEHEFIVRECLKKLLYPSKTELGIYESKRVLAAFLGAAKIPHPNTFVTHDRKEAFDYAAQCSLPQVFKTNTGSASIGVEIITKRSNLVRLISAIFDGFYVNRAIVDCRDIDFNYVVLQEFLPNVREFRVIKIGDSWFGHEKDKSSDSLYFSGSGRNSWTAPPITLLNFCREISEKHGFSVMCFDIFVTQDGRYLVNELQTWFGSYDPSQMYLNGIPGRYVYSAHEWRFESGFFNVNNSMTLRLATYLNSFFENEK
jgi:glutathione synthase/RimK-type ligase-like ATP-grasp enzyme